MGVSVVKTELAGLGGGSEHSVDAPAVAGDADGGMRTALSIR